MFSIYAICNDAGSGTKIELKPKQFVQVFERVLPLYEPNVTARMTYIFVAHTSEKLVEYFYGWFCTVNVFIQEVRIIHVHI